MGKYSKFGVGIALLVLCLGLIWCWYWYWPVPPLDPEMNRYDHEWPLPNHDYGNTRTSRSSLINAGNVNKLRPTWSYPTEGQGKLIGSPVIQADTVYWQDSASNLSALDLESGTLKWERKYNLERDLAIGPLLVRKRIFISRGYHQVAALDMMGNELWSKTTESGRVNGQMLEYGGLIYISTIAEEDSDPGAKGVHEVLYALDYRTGEPKWSLNTNVIEQLWGSAAGEFRGGAAHPFVFDTGSAALFWLASSLSPAVQDGSRESGFGTFTTLTALKHDTGNLLWHQRLPNPNVPGLDFSIPVLLAPAETETVQRNQVLAAGRMGNIYAFDLINGQALWEASPGDYSDEGLRTQKKIGTGVGIRTPMAYQEGILYVPVVNSSSGNQDDEEVIDASRNDKGGSRLLAVDSNLGKILWAETFDSEITGAATVINDLVFTATRNGKVYACKRHNGEKVWEYQVPGRSCGPPAAAGRCIVFPVANGGQPGLLNFSL